jgi:hypothetical protein
MKIKKTATLTISELAYLKDCSRQTIYNCYEQFDKIEFASKEKIVWNEKVEKFNPDQTKTPNQFKK